MLKKGTKAVVLPANSDCPFPHGTEVKVVHANKAHNEDPRVPLIYFCTDGESEGWCIPQELIVKSS